MPGGPERRASLARAKLAPSGRADLGRAEPASRDGRAERFGARDGRAAGQQHDARRRVAGHALAARLERDGRVRALRGRL